MRHAFDAVAKVQQAGVTLQARAGDVASKLRGRSEPVQSKQHDVALNAKSAEDLHKSIECMAERLKAGTAIVTEDWIVNIAEKHQQCAMCCSQAGLGEDAFGTTDFVMYVMQHPEVNAILNDRPFIELDRNEVCTELLHPVSNANFLSKNQDRHESLKEVLSANVDCSSNHHNQNARSLDGHVLSNSNQEEAVKHDSHHEHDAALVGRIDVIPAGSPLEPVSPIRDDNTGRTWDSAVETDENQTQQQNSAAAYGQTIEDRMDQQQPDSDRIDDADEKLSEATTPAAFFDSLPQGSGTQDTCEQVVQDVAPGVQSEVGIKETSTISRKAAVHSDDHSTGELASKLVARRLQMDTAEELASTDATELATKLAARRNRIDTGDVQLLSPRSQRLADGAAAELHDGCGVADGRSMKEKMAARRRQLDGATQASS